MRKRVILQTTRAEYLEAGDVVRFTPKGFFFEVERVQVRGNMVNVHRAGEPLARILGRFDLVKVQVER